MEENKPIRTLKKLTLDYFEYALVRNNTNKAKTARELGVSVRTVCKYADELIRVSDEYRKFEKGKANKRIQISKTTDNGEFKINNPTKSKTIYKLRNNSSKLLGHLEYPFPTNNERLEYADRLINSEIPIKG